MSLSAFSTILATTTLYQSSLARTAPPSQWGEWEAWSPCSTTCGNTAIRERVRICYTSGGSITGPMNCVGTEGYLWSSISYCSHLAQCEEKADSKTKKVKIQELAFATQEPVQVFTDMANARDYEESGSGAEVFTIDWQAKDEPDLSQTGAVVEKKLENSESVPGPRVLLVASNSTEVSSTEVKTPSESAGTHENTTELVTTTTKTETESTTPYVPQTTVAVTTKDPRCTGDSSSDECGCYKAKCWKYCEVFGRKIDLWCWTTNPSTGEVGSCDGDEHSSCGSEWTCSGPCGF